MEVGQANTLPFILFPQDEKGVRKLILISVEIMQDINNSIQRDTKMSNWKYGSYIALPVSRQASWL